MVREHTVMGPPGLSTFEVGQPFVPGAAYRFRLTSFVQLHKVCGILQISNANSPVNQFVLT